MTKIEDIEKAISALAPEEYAQLRAWFEALDAERFDARIEQDAANGTLDRLAADAFADFRAGRLRDL
jgi:hypothetical protein